MTETIVILQCVASIASAELPQNKWLDLLPNLVLNIENAQSSFQLKEASLEAIGYMCQDIVSIFMLNFVQMIYLFYLSLPSLLLISKIKYLFDFLIFGGFDPPMYSFPHF